MNKNQHSVTEGSKKGLIYGALTIIILLIYKLYSESLKNGFAFDDVVWIINNELIRDFSWEGIKAIFSNFNGINYAPITDLINSVLYQFDGSNPTVFHKGSLFFHLLNVVLVFVFILSLNKKWYLAAIIALFFGIHPMQVESVAWVSGGSNLYSATFFLTSLIFYLFYLKEKEKRFYFLSLFFFMVSLLSKSAVIMLPVVLIFIDYFKERKITLSVLLEKAPYFVISLGFGILSIYLRSTGVAFKHMDYTILERIVFACYGFVTYIIKILLPFKLSAFYPYPSDGITLQYYLYPILLLGILVLTIYSRRFSKRILLFSMGFFAATIFVVLQLFPTSQAIIADRYIYLASIGIFHLMGEGIVFLWNKKNKFIALAFLGVFTVLFSVKTNTRCMVWNDNLSLWSDVISKYDNVQQAYYSRGHHYMSENKYEEAIEDYTDAIKYNPDYIEAYINRGNAFMEYKQYELALIDLSKAVEIDSKNINAYIHRGNVYLEMKKYQEAYDDFSKVITINPQYEEAYINRGNALKYLNKFDEALRDYQSAIDLHSKTTKAYFNRGTLYLKIKDYNKAQNDLIKAIELNPNYEKAYNNLGSAYTKQKKYSEAIAVYSKLIEINPGHATAFFNRGIAKYYSGDNNAACLDFQNAASLGSPQAKDVIYQLCK